jgi:hypothetical protein
LHNKSTEKYDEMWSVEITSDSDGANRLILILNEKYAQKYNPSEANPKKENMLP